MTPSIARGPGALDAGDLDQPLQDGGALLGVEILAAPSLVDAAELGHRRGGDEPELVLQVAQSLQGGVLSFSITMSLDGYAAGPNQSVEHPLGEGGDRLHERAFAVKTFRQAHGMEGGSTGPDDAVVAESLEDIGATLMGRRMLGGGPGPWGTSRGMAGGATIRPSTRRSSSSPTTRASR